MMGRRKGKKGQFFYSFDLDKVVPPEQIWSSGTMLSIHLRCTKQKIFANTSANTLVRNQHEGVAPGEVPRPEECLWPDITRSQWRG